MEQTLGRASTNTHTSARQRTQNNPLTHRMPALVSADLAIKRKGYSGTLCFPSIALAYILFFGKNYEFFFMCVVKSVQLLCKSNIVTETYLLMHDVLT